MIDGQASYWRANHDHNRAGQALARPADQEDTFTPTAALSPAAVARLDADFKDPEGTKLREFATANDLSFRRLPGQRGKSGSARVRWELSFEMREP
jgi:hypothetical protein